MNALRSARAYFVLALLVIAGMFSTAEVARAATPRDLHIITPCRIYDSRLPGASPSGPLAEHVPHAVNLPSPDRCGVPTDAVSLIINATIVNPPSDGYLVVFQGGTALPAIPPGALAFQQSDILGQFRVVQLGTSPAPELSVEARMGANDGQTFHVVIDVLAYNGSGAPSDIALSNNTVPENADDAVVGTFSTTDPDFDDTHTYTLVSGTGDTDNAKFQIVSGNELRTAEPLDREEPGRTPVGEFKIRVRSTDNFGVLFEKEFTIIASNVNEPPVLVAGGVLNYSEGDSATAIDAGLTITDDSTNLQSATVQITGNYQNGQDVLSFVNTATITAGAFDTATGTLTLTGTDTVANWQTALRNVLYNNTSNDPSALTRTVTWIATDDGSLSSTGVTSTINLSSNNSQPTITEIADQTIDEDTSTSALAFTVGDAETAVASLTVTGTSSNQALIPDANVVFGGSGANRTVTVTPAANANGGPVTITITVNDGSGAPNSTNTETFNVTITAANDQPTITAIDDLAIDEDTSTGALAFTVGDAETVAGSLTVTVSSSDQAIIPDANIVLGGTNPNRTVTVTPAPNANGGPVTITITVNDGSGAPNATATETFNVTVTAVNDQPTISDVPDQVVNEDNPTNALPVTVGDLETPVGSLTLSGTSSDQSIVPNANIVFGGSGANRTVTVTPAANANGGPVTITITVNDGSGAPNATASETFSLTVNSVNDDPTITPIADQTINEDTSTGPLAFTIGDVDTAVGSLTITATSSDQTLIPDANVVLGGSGTSRTVTVTPAPNQFGGPVTITITVNDGGGSPAVETFSVTVTSVNDQPTITGITNQTIDEDTSTPPLAFTIGDVETAAGTLTVSGMSSNGTLIPNGNIVIGGSGANRTVTVTPAANQFGGPVTITITVDDGSGTANATNSTTFTVTVNSVNDQPTITGIANQTIDEDTSTGALAFTIGDVETAAGSLSVSGASSNTTIIPNGNIVIGGSGANRTVTITPAANQFGGPVTITITVNDGSAQPNSTNTSVFTVTVNPVNDAPTLADTTLEYTVLGNTQLRVGELASGTGLLHLRDNQDLLEKSGPTDIDSPAVFDVVLVSGPTNGQLTLDANGTYRYEPNAGFEGTDSFQVGVRDNAGAQSVPVTVTITISQMVWFVRDIVDGDNPAAGDDGRSTNAFEVLGDVEPVLTDNDFIFVFEGNTATTPLDGGIDIDNAGVKLLGQGAGLTVPGFGTLINPGNRPRITNVGVAGGPEDNGVNIIATAASLNGIEIRGLNISGRDNAIDVTATGAHSTGVTIQDVTVSGSGLEGIDVNAGSTGTTTVSVSNVGLTATGNAFDARTSAAGNLRIDFSNNGDILSNAAGVVIDGAGGGVTTITGFANNTVHPNTAGTGISVNAALFDATAGGAVNRVYAGNTRIGVTGDGVGGAGLSLTNVTGDLAFGDVSTLGDLDVYSAGAALTATSTVVGGIPQFRLTVMPTDNAGTSTLVATAGAAVDIDAVTADLRLSGLSSSGGLKGVSLVRLLPGSPAATFPAIFRAPSGSSINTSNAAATAFRVDQSNATVTYQGLITTTAGRGVDLTSNTGSTIGFSGTLSLSSGTSPAFTATGGGTVTATDTASTLSTTTATALNVGSTTIGSTGLRFRSISAGTGSGSSGVGIVLDSTGTGVSDGGLTVSGNSGPGTGGTIQHKTGADGATTSGIGIFLNNTKNVSLSWMQLNDFDNSAIAGRNVQGFTLQNSVVSGTIGTTNVGSEGPIMFGLSNPSGTNGLQGTGLIRNTKISGGVEHNLEFYNQSGSMNLTIEGVNAVSEGANPNSAADDVADCIIEENSVALGGDGIQVEMQGTATASVVIDRCLFRDNKSQAVQVSALNSSVVSLTIDESRARRFDQGNEGFILQNGGDADLTAIVSNNHINSFGGTAIFAGQVAGNASAASALNVTISGNTITQPATATNHGIIAFLTSTVGQLSQARVRIDGNSVANNSTSGTTRGILVDTPDTSTSPVFHATVTNNTVSIGDSVAGVAGIVVQGRQSSDVCASIGNNSVTFPNGTPAGVSGLRARQVSPGTFDLEQSAGCSGTAASVLACRNPGSTTEVLGTLTVVSTGACLLPATP